MMDRFTNQLTSEILEAECLELFPTPAIVTPFPKHKNYKWESFERVNRKPDSWFTPLNTSFPDIEDDDPYIDKETSDRLRKTSRNIYRSCSNVITCHTRLDIVPSGIMHIMRVMLKNHMITWHLIITIHIGVVYTLPRTVWMVN